MSQYDLNIEKSNRASSPNDEDPLDLNSHNLMLFGILASIIFPIYEWSYKHEIYLSCSIVTYLGIMILVFGIITRLWSIQVLDKYFMSNMAIPSNHKLVQKGLYKHIRHPAYTGSLLCLIGFSVTLEAWISLPVVVVIFLFVCNDKMNSQEKLLIKHFGKQYELYQRFSWRLIPGIW